MFQSRRSVPHGGRGGRTTIEAVCVRVSSASIRVHSGGSAASGRCIDSGERFIAALIDSADAKPRCFLADSSRAFPS